LENSYNKIFADFIAKNSAKVFEGFLGKLFSKSFPKRSPTNQNFKKMKKPLVKTAKILYNRCNYMKSWRIL